MAQTFKTAISIVSGAASSQAIAAKVDGDTQNRINIDAGGKITWGSGSATGDTTLYRSAADTLKSDDAFTAASLAVTGAFTFPTSDGSANQVITTNGSGTLSWANAAGSVTVSDAPPSGASEGDLWFESDTGSTYVYYDSAWVEVGASTSTAVGGEGYVQYYSSGSLAGASAHYWDAANERLGIKNTSPAYELDVTGTIRGTNVIGSSGVTTVTTTGAPTASASDGTIAVDTTNDVLYIRSNGAWVESSGGASVTVSDAAPSGAEEGDLWYKSDVGTTLVYYDSAWVEITGSGSSSAYKLTSSSRDAALFIMEIGP